MTAILSNGDDIRLPFLGAFGRRMFLSLALVSLLLVAAVGGMGYRQTRQALMKEAREHLGEVARARRVRLEIWFDERREDMVLLSAHIDKTLSDDLETAAVIEELLDMQLEAQPAYRHFAVFDTEGSLIASAGEPVHEECMNSECPEVRNAMTSGEIVLGRFILDADDEPTMRLSAPLSLGDEFTGALLAVLRPAASINPILADTSGLGRSGETYLVGADMTMLTPSRHMNHPPALTHKMPTPGVLACLESGSGISLYTSYMGEEVLGAYEWLPAQRWALIAEIRTAEAFAPLRGIAHNTVLIACVALLLALLISITLSRRLSSPIGRLAVASDRVAAGDWSPLPVIRGPGEIGILARHFAIMVASLSRSRTELEQSSRQLAQAEKLAEIGRLAAGLVHEMRNPLAAIKMNLSNLTRSRSLTAIEEEQLQIACEEGERLELMLAEFLAFSRPVELKRALVSLEYLLGKVEQLTEAERAPRGILLKFERQTTDREILVDSEMLLRAIINLVYNAAQALPENGIVRLVAGEDEGALVIDIEDEGRGMPQPELDRIFDPFFTTREGGVGLGICNARKYVELHEGRLTIASREGEGTRARITLPAGESNA
ncbi:MAG: HAMP domain-containing protein [bacterium]|nr:HAMP domain-containing protein [bacterium]